METSLFSSGQNSHRFALPIRQFSNRSDLLYVPTLGTFLSYERSLLRSFGSPQLRRTWSKKTSKFSSGKVKVFQWKSQTFPVEKSNFSSRKAKLFQWKSQTFPVEKSNFSGVVSMHFPGESGNWLTVFVRAWWCRGWRWLPRYSMRAGRGACLLGTSRNLRIPHVIFGRYRLNRRHLPTHIQACRACTLLW